MGIYQVQGMLVDGLVVIGESWNRGGNGRGAKPELSTSTPTTDSRNQLAPSTVHGWGPA